MTATENKPVQETIANLPAELQEVVSKWTDRFHAQNSDLPGQVHDLRVLTHLVATSDFAARVLLRDWEWFHAALQSGEFSRPLQETAIRHFKDDLKSSGADADVVKSRLRRFRNRALIHVLWRTIEGTGNLQESLLSLSNLADGLIDAPSPVPVTCFPRGLDKRGMCWVRRFHSLCSRWANSAAASSIFPLT